MNFQQVESARYKYGKKLKITIVAAAIIFVVTIIVTIIDLFSLGRESTFGGIRIAAIGIPIALIALIVALFATNEESKAYKKLYKAYFVEKALAEIFTNINYNRDEGLPSSVPASTGMISMGDEYSSNDLVIAQYKNTKFVQADVVITKKNDESVDVLFMGRWMMFEFPKKFNFKMAVVQREFSSFKLPNSTSKSLKGFQEIQTESTTFNKKFKVYAEDGFEAFYILDPSFIDQIEKLGQIHKGRILLIFTNNILHVAIWDGNDAFEPPSVLKTLDETAETKKVKQEISLVTSFVDYLKLDRKLFES